MTPRWTNCHATVESVPPWRVKTLRTSEAVRLRLSVIAATITATLAGPMPS